MHTDPATVWLVFLGSLLAFAGKCQGGYCWSFVGKDGRCTEVLKANVSREVCCSDNSATTAWSKDDLHSGDLFFWRMVGGGVKCELCKNSCEGVHCPEGKKCVIKNGNPKCVCSPHCPRRRKGMGEVCGTDGRTYRHVCRLLKRQCRKEQQLTVAYYGPCRKSCESVKCPGKKTCILDQNLRPHCVRCKTHCPSSPERYICGADDITYASVCHIRQAACMKGKAIQESYKGRCQANATCETIKCRKKGKKCLLDLETRLPRCVTCPDKCYWPKTDPLCASNNVTYKSWCHMMQDSCKNGVLLHARNDGSCEESSSVPEANIFPITVHHGISHS